MSSLPNMLPEFQDHISGMLDLCNLKFDPVELWTDITTLIKHYDFDILAALQSTPIMNININYPDLQNPNVQTCLQSNRPSPINDSYKYFGTLASGGQRMASQGIYWKQFQHIGEFFLGRYTEQVVYEMKSYHAKMWPDLPPIGKIMCALMKPGTCYKLHIDPYARCKYHLPLRTNDYSLMSVISESGIRWLHLPASGQVWRLDSKVLHSAINLSPNDDDYRAHLIFSVDY